MACGVWKVRTVYQKVQREKDTISGTRRWYEQFIRRNSGKKILFLELGVGMNTPGIIKYPFWQMTAKQEHAFYICVNKGQAWAPLEIRERALCMDIDLAEAVGRLMEERTVE